MSATEWRERLLDRMPPDLAEEIDIFEGQMELRRRGAVEERVFAETRLRRGAYGQRYDNGQRHDGIATQQLELPYRRAHQGPRDALGRAGDAAHQDPLRRRQRPSRSTCWPTWPRSTPTPSATSPRGRTSSSTSSTSTTRRTIFRRLAAVGITTREACGNSVRNVTACPLAGVCHTETFDVTPYAKALRSSCSATRDTQDFGRKFKIAFSGCARRGVRAGHACTTSAASPPDGRSTATSSRGFELYVGGGLGAVPHQAKLLDEFVPEEELLPAGPAIGRVFARLGEKKNRNRARLKFVVAKLGIDEFRRLVDEERATLPDDPRWTHVPRPRSARLRRDAACARRVPARRTAPATPEGFDEWAQTNVYRQRQPGYVVATVTLPLGDITADQTRTLADIARTLRGRHGAHDGRAEHRAALGAASTTCPRCTTS